MYSNETQSPWSLSHHGRTIFGVKATPPSKSAKPSSANRAASRSHRRQQPGGDIRSNPLFLQNLFAANVRLVRVAQGLSQEELADRATNFDEVYASRDIARVDLHRPQITVTSSRRATRSAVELAVLLE